jgi:hypothetical protein
MSTCYTTKEEKAKEKNCAAFKELHARNTARRSSKIHLICDEKIGKVDRDLPIKRAIS